MPTLRKSHKLRHKRLIDPLFEQGYKINAYPIRMFWKPLSDSDLQKTFCDSVPDLIGPDQILISIPKKKLRHAVDRVRMRRLIREAYRLNSNELRKAIQDSENVRTISLGFVYFGDKLTDFNHICSRMKKLLASLLENAELL